MHIAVVEDVGRVGDDNYVRYMKKNEQCSGIFIPHVGPGTEKIFAFSFLHKAFVLLYQCISIQQPTQVKIHRSLLNVVISLDLTLQ